MENRFLTSCYVLDIQKNVWSRLGYTGISYSDGDETELHIANVINQAADITVLSTELRQHCTNWPTLYHLSGTRANILRPFAASLTGDILEIGAGCGALTRYLGECGANVLALEGSPRRAAIVRSRTRDLKNVTVLAEKFDQFQCDHQFDLITLIGVLEYANLFTSSENPALTMLKQVRSLLKPDGKLIIAIENQLGLKYFAGAPEDHLGQPMYGIEGRYRKDQPQTFGRAVLADLLKEASFAKAEFLAPFPDYKLPVSILTEEGLSNKKFDGAALAWQSVRHDPQLPPNTNFSLELTWPEVFTNGLALNMANSFLIVASPLQQKVIEPGVLGYHYSTDRSPPFCKETVFKYIDESTIVVNYHMLGGHHDDGRNRVINFSCPVSAAYAEGVPLSFEFVKIVTRDDWSIEEVGAFIQRYINLLILIADKKGKLIGTSKLADKLPGDFFDLVPQNIIVNHRGQPIPIDTEWSLNDDIELGWVLFRTLLLAMESVMHFGKNSTAQAFSRRTFVKSALKAAGYSCTDEDFLRFIKLEAVIQQQVAGRSSEDFLNWLPEQPLPTNLAGERNAVVIQRDEKISSLNEAIAERDNRIVSLSQAVIERDQGIANLGEAIAERDHRIANLNQVTIERGNGIPTLDEAVAERDKRIAYLDRALIECDNRIAKLDQAVVERDKRIAKLDQAVVEHDKKTAQLDRTLIERDNKIASLDQALIELNNRIVNLDQALIERDNRIANLNQAHLEINTRITAIENSTLWKMSFPLRRALTTTPTLRKLCRRTVKVVWWTSTFQLGTRLREWMTRDVVRVEAPHFAPPTDDYCLAVPLGYCGDKWKSVPRVAVICHMFYPEIADEFQSYLTNIPFPFDLLITTDSQEKRSTIENYFSQWHRGKIEVRIAPNRGRDIAPKLIVCRDVYDEYEFVLHIHTKKSPHADVLGGWRFYLLETLLGSEQIVESIFESFRSDRKLGIIAPQHFAPIHHCIGWGWNFENAKTFARRIGVKIPPDGRLDFPSGSMFWARSAALKPLLNCGLSLDEFAREEDQIDGTLAHVIERLYFFICERAGYRWIKISQSSMFQQPERIKHVKNQKELLNFIKNTQYELLKSRILQFLSSLLQKSGDDASGQQRKMDRLIYEKSDYRNIDFSQFQRELALHIKKKESLIDFDEKFYLHANPDVAEAIAKGIFSCGFIHYCLIGQDEGRIWSDYQLERVFSASPNFPDGFNAPVNIRPLPRYKINLSRLPRSPESFLLIFFSHLQDDLFFAGYAEFFHDFSSIFGQFSKIILSVENENFNPRLATRYSDRIEVMQYRELAQLKYRPDLILAFNSKLSLKAKQICNDPNRTIYYCQDFEPGFFPYGAEYVEAEKAITSSSNIIISTSLLRNFLVDRGLLGHQRIFTTSPKIEPFDVGSDKAKRLFFYFRPESFHGRNLPEILMEVVQNFCEKYSGYEIYMAGAVDTRYSYKINRTPVYIISKLPQKDYIQLISSCDVVVSLIYSAHPGVIAFQAAASGIPTVTNIFENRNAVLLKQISENILPYDPVRENLLELIEEALTMPKGKKSFNEVLYSDPETQSLDDFINTVLSSE